MVLLTLSIWLSLVAVVEAMEKIGQTHLAVEVEQVGTGHLLLVNPLVEVCIKELAKGGIIAPMAMIDVLFNPISFEKLTIG